MCESAVQALELRAGFAAVDITPKHPVELAGYAGRVQPSTGVHDSVFCRALALESGGRRLLIVALDLLDMAPDRDRALRESVAGAVGIGAGDVMLHCVHPHSAPALWAMGRCYQPDPDFVDGLGARVEDAARGAFENLGVRRVFYGVGHSSEWLYNRHQELRGGGFSLAYVADRSEVVATGPVDDRLRVLAFEREDGTPDGVVVHYGCHPVMMSGLNREISADYPGALIRHLSRRTGMDSGRIVFLNGACGDINPMRGPANDWGALDAMGAALADAAAGAIQRREPLGGAGVASASGRFVVRYRPEDAVRRAERRKSAEVQLAHLREAPTEDLRQPGGTPAEVADSRRNTAETVIEWVRRADAGDLPTSEEMDVSVFRIGEFKVAAAPFELLTQVGLDASVAIGEPLAVLYTTNGCTGYLGDASVYGHSRSYELGQSYVWYGRPGPFEADTAGRLVSLWEDLSGRL